MTKNRKKIISEFNILTLFLLSTFFLSSLKANNKTPKLVVGLVVDQMRYDYIFRYWNKFGENGFKKLVNKGFFCKNANYNYVPTITAPGHASIYTGTTPAVHGIVGNEWYSEVEKSEVYCVEDSTVKSIGTNGSQGLASPRRMLVTTLGDELKLHTIGHSKVIGIALKDRSAILPAGHTANAAYWFEAQTGNFISSSYYLNQLPKWVSDFNNRKLPHYYLQNGWSALLPVAQYKESIEDDNAYERASNKKEKPVFPYEYKAYLDKNNVDIIKSTPWGNTLTKDFALAAISGEDLGKDEYTDLLCVSFSSTDYIGHAYGPYSVEIEDTYIRLDKEIENLLLSLDKEVGPDQYLLFLTADHGVSDVPAHLIDQKIPSGYFNKTEAIKQLKTQLKSIYGDSLVITYINQQIYLNNQVIRANKLDKEVIEKYCAEFMLQMDGIAETYTAASIRTQNYDNGLFRNLLQKGYNFKRSGDVLVCYQPSWLDIMGKGTTHGAEFSYDTHVPLIFYGSQIKAGYTMHAVSIEDIVPTLCLLLNIPFTNGNTGMAIEELFQK